MTCKCECAITASVCVSESCDDPVTLSNPLPAPGACWEPRARVLTGGGLEEEAAEVMRQNPGRR